MKKQLQRKKEIQEKRKQRMVTYNYFKELKKGKIKKKERRNDLEMGKRDELLEKLSDLGVKIKVGKQYSIGYHPINMEIETEADGYETALEFMELELIKLADELPLERLKELSLESKGDKGFSSSANKKTYPKKKNSQKPSSGLTKKPYGSQGSDKQWGIIFDDRNRDKLIELGFLTEDGKPDFDVTNYEIIKKVVNKCFD